MQTDSKGNIVLNLPAEITARFTASLSKDGSSVNLFDNGRHFSTLATKDFEAHGKEMIEAFSKGEAFSPLRTFAGQTMAPAQTKERKLDALEHGGNITRNVSEWVRYLATKEAREGGIFDASIDALDVEQWPAFAREIFDSLYSQKIEDAPLAAGADWVRELVNQAEATDEWNALRKEVQGDPWATGIAAGRVLTNLKDKAKELLETVPKQDPERLQQEAEAMEEMLGKKHALTKAANKAAIEAFEQAQVAQTVAAPPLEGALSQLGAVAVAAANQAKHEVVALMKGAGDLAGLGTGALAGIDAPPEKVRKLLADNPKLRKIAELAGRLRIRARAKQKTKTKYAPESIVDVTLGGELERLLPSELAQLMMPETEMLLLRKLQEREAMQYELEGNEELDRGPVMMFVDSSGSMQGIRNEWAMAVAIAVLEIAAMQKRPFVLGHFDSDMKECFTVEQPSKLSLDELVKMVSYFSGGGTNFAPPLQRAHSIITSGKQKDGVFARADVMLITDGQANWGDWARLVKATGASLYGVEIESGFNEMMKLELTGCAHVNPHELNNLSANVDLLFGI